MSAVVPDKIVLFDETGVTATANGDAVSLPSNLVDIVGFATLINDTNGTVDAKIQHSPDGGVNWLDLITFTQATTADLREMEELDDLNHRVFPTVRAVVTIGGGADYDVKIELLGRRGP